MERYLGEKKVLTVAEIPDKKTPLDNDYVKITFEDGSSVEMTKKRYEYSETPKQINDLEMKSIFIRKASSQIYSLLHEYDLNLSEIDEVLDAAGELANSGLSQATKILWGIDDLGDRSLNKINNILLDDARKRESKESINDSTSTGDGSNSEDTK